MGVSPAVIMSTPAIYNDNIYLASTTGGWKIGGAGVVGGGPTVNNGDFYCLDLSGNVVWHDTIPYDIKTQLTKVTGYLHRRLLLLT